MDREEQLSLCFEPHVDEGSSISSEQALLASIAELQPLAKVLRFKSDKQQRPVATDVNSARLLEKITRKVKYF